MLCCVLNAALLNTAVMQLTFVVTHAIGVMHDNPVAVMQP